MKSAKINVSEDELQLMLNKEWLYLKRNIIEKVSGFLGSLHKEYTIIAKRQEQSLAGLPVGRMGKISRGENLCGLPYLILDYPASFTKEKIVAVRTLFWWGNFFSISLHLSGLSVTPERSLPWIEYFKSRDFCINASGDEWNFEFGEQGFRPFPEENNFYSDRISKNGIFRVARKTPLTRWAAAQEQLLQDFKMIINFLAANFPGDGKDLSPAFPKAGLNL